MPPERHYHVFISHTWTYDRNYYRLQDLLDSASQFKWSNYSVPYPYPLSPHTDASLERQLRGQIQPVHVVLIIASMYAEYSKWIQKEIDMASEMRKPIVGITDWDDQMTPLAIREAVVEMVAWDVVSIVRAIQDHAL